MMPHYPPQFDFLRPYADRCEAVVTREIFIQDFRPQLTRNDVDSFVNLYRRLAEPELYRRVEQWCNDDPTSDAVAHAAQLFIVLDWMADADLIPAELTKTRFVDWDDRALDDAGNEW